MLIGHPVYQHGCVLCTSAHGQYAKIRLFQHFNFLNLLYLVLFVPYGTYSWNSRLRNITFLKQFIRFLSRWLPYYLFLQFFQSCSPAVCRSPLSQTSLWVPFESLFCYGACRFPYCMPNPLQRTFTDLFNYCVLFCSNIEVFVTNCLRPPYLTYKAKTLVDTWILCWGSLISLLVSYL